MSLESGNVLTRQKVGQDHVTLDFNVTNPLTSERAAQSTITLLALLIGLRVSIIGYGKREYVWQHVRQKRGNG